VASDALRLFLVVYTYGDDATRRERHRDAHVRFLGELSEQGVNLMSGPLDDGATGGMQLIAAGSRQDVVDLMAKDPYAVGGVIANVEVREWTPLLGRLVPHLRPAPGARRDGSIQARAEADGRGASA
jgi:uncharacterized protein YciI